MIIWREDHPIKCTIDYVTNSTCKDQWQADQKPHRFFCLVELSYEIEKKGNHNKSEKTENQFSAFFGQHDPLATPIFGSHAYAFVAEGDTKGHARVFNKMNTSPIQAEDIKSWGIAEMCLYIDLKWLIYDQDQQNNEYENVGSFQKCLLWPDYLSVL